MSGRLLRWCLAGMLCGMAAVPGAHGQTPRQKVAAAPAEYDAEVADKSDGLRAELAKIQAEVQRLQLEVAQLRQSQREKNQQLLQATVGEPAQTADLRPGETLRFHWPDDIAWWPTLSPDGHWGFVSSGGGTMPRLLDLKSGVERLLVDPDPSRRMPVRGFFSRDNRLFGLSYTNGDTEIFDLQERKRLIAFKIPISVSGGTWQAEFTPDAKQIVVGIDGNIQLLDLAEGQQVKKFPIGMAQMASMTLSRDGHFVTCAGGSSRSISGPVSDTVRVFDLKTESIVFRITPTTHSTANHAFLLPDNKRLLVKHSNRLSLFDIQANRELTTLPISGSARAVDVSSDNQFAAVAGYDKGLQIWDLATQRLRHVFITDEPGFQGVAWSGDGQRLLTSSRDGTVRLWTLPALPPQAKLPLPPPATLSSAQPQVAPRIASNPRPSVTPLPTAVDQSTRKAAQRIPADQAGIHSLAWLPDGKQLLALGNAGLRLYDLPSQSSQAVGPEPASGRSTTVQSMALLPDGQSVVYGGGEPGGNTVLGIWNLRDEAEQGQLEGHLLAVNAVAVSADGKLVASADENRWIVVRDADSGRILQRVRDHQAVKKLIFLPRQDQLATITANGIVNFYDLTTGKHVNSTAGPGKTISLVSAPNGKSQFLAHRGVSNVAVSERGLNPTRIQRQWTGNGTGLIALSPSGEYLAIGSTNDEHQLISVWHTSQARFVATFSAGSAEFAAMAFSPDGAQLVAASGDEHLYFWDIPAPGRKPRRAR